MSNNKNLATKLGAINKSAAATNVNAKEMTKALSQDSPKSEVKAQALAPVQESFLAGGKSTSEKASMLSKFVTTMNKQSGPGTVVLGTEGVDMVTHRLSSGSPEVDFILNGGFPAGRIVEIYGPESSGKSTICWSTIAGVQRRGGLVCYVDTEHALDRQYLMKMGVDLDKMAISQPNSAEAALEIVENAVKAGIFDMVVLDSVAALAPEKELEKEIRDATMALTARLMSAVLRRITAEVATSKTLVVFINQIRMKIGGYGNPETTTGGNALKFYASVRLDVRRIEYVKDGETVVGQKMIIKTIKNKTGSPFQKAEATLIFGMGFDQVTGAYEEAIQKLVITKGGGSHYMQGNKADKLAASRSAMIERLRTEPELLAKIKEINAVTEVPKDEVAV